MSALPKPSETNAPTLEVRVSQTPVEKFREYLASRPRPQRFTGQQRDMVRFIFAQHNHFDAELLVHHDIVLTVTALPGASTTLGRWRSRRSPA